MLIDSPHAWTKAKTNIDVANGKALAESAHRWMELHEQEFTSIAAYVKSLQALGVKGRLRDRVAVWCMANKVEVRDGDYRFANGLWAGISRYMALQDPSLVGAPIRFADSEIDTYGLLPVSWLGLED